MKKNNTTILLLLALLILGGFGFYKWKTTSNKSSTIDIRDRQFAVEDRSDIAKIFIAQRNGKTLTLEKEVSSWKVNNDYVVHPNIMNNILDVLTGLRLKYIPPNSAVQKMIPAIGRLGVKVEVFDAEGDLLKSYQVGGTTAGELGTVFLMDGYTQPYVMELPNFEGSLRGRFLFDNAEQLRDRTVFAIEEEDIQSIAINYPKDQRSSFRLEREGGGFNILPYSPDSYVATKALKPGAIERFVRSFQDLDAEAFENQHVLKDSIRSLIPIAEVDVKTRDGSVKSIKMFSHLDVFNPEIITRAVNVDKRVERYFVDCSWGDFMLVQHLLFGKILWKYNEFFE